MDRAARSVFVFGIYLVLLGLGLLLFPNPLLTLFGFEPVPDIWIRVVGQLVLVLGLYCLAAARTGTAAFYRWSVAARLATFLVFTAFVSLGLAKPMLLLFAFIDLAGATWTIFALRGKKTNE